MPLPKDEQLTVAGSDALLLPLLQARDQSTAERLLTQLIQEHADPIIARILKSKLRASLNGSQGNHQNQDALEIASEVRTTLIGDLRGVQEHPLHALRASARRCGAHERDFYHTGTNLQSPLEEQLSTDADHLRFFRNK